MCCLLCCTLGVSGEEAFSAPTVSLFPIRFLVVVVVLVCKYCAHLLALVRVWISLSFLFTLPLTHFLLPFGRIVICQLFDTAFECVNSDFHASRGRGLRPRLLPPLPYSSQTHTVFSFFLPYLFKIAQLCRRRRRRRSLPLTL